MCSDTAQAHPLVKKEPPHINFFLPKNKIALWQQFGNYSKVSKKIEVTHNSNTQQSLLLIVIYILPYYVHAKRNL